MAQLYIELLKKTLTDYHRIDRGEFKPIYSEKPSWKFRLLLSLNKYLSGKGYYICERTTFTKKDRMEGRDWPMYADTMIGLLRLNNIEYCVQNIIRDNIEGDFIETGVWRGGATIFMRGLLKAHNIEDKSVWVADSFEGLPKPDGKKYPIDKGDLHHTMRELAVSIDDVKNNFVKYDLLDDKVKFLKGWFKDTLPSAPIEKLSLIRLDGDMYESTMDGLVNLYPKLSKGGYVIVDDWGELEGCRKAVLDYRAQQGIHDPIEKIDWSGVYWRKEN